MLRIHHFTPRGASREVKLADLPKVLRARGTVWVDLLDPTDDEFLSIAKTFQWHPLAIEDCRVETHLPKVDDFDDYLLLVLHNAKPDNGADGLKTSEMELFLSRNALVTHHGEKIEGIEVLVQRAQRNPTLAARGPAYLLYLLLDAMEDDSLRYLDDLDDRLDAVENALLGTPGTDTLNAITRLKREVVGLRRFAIPQAEVLRRLGRGEFPMVPADATVYFRDIYDHLYRLSDTADSYRDLLTGALDAYLSAVSNNMNSVMKVLTVFASVLLPMTFLVGVWGMNFRHMPELSWRYGYALAWGVMVAVAIALGWFFRRRRWI
jgi:magnesium transporter